MPLCIDGQLKSRINLNKSFQLLCNSRLLNYIGLNTSNEMSRCVVLENVGPVSLCIVQELKKDKKKETYTFKEIIEFVLI